MYMNSFNIGSSPSDEECIQLMQNDPHCQKKQKIECKLFIEALLKKHGKEPFAAKLFVKRNQHDFGTYYEVECAYDDNHPESLEYALKCEGDGPATWAEVGMKKPIFDSNGDLIVELEISEDSIEFLASKLEWYKKLWRCGSISGAEFVIQVMTYAIAWADKQFSN